MPNLLRLNATEDDCTEACNLGTIFYNRMLSGFHGFEHVAQTVHALALYRGLPCLLLPDGDRVARLHF